MPIRVSVLFATISLLMAPLAVGQSQASEATNPPRIDPAPAGSQRIYYTGKLFGYYRIEYGESEDQYLDSVAAFLKNRKAFRDDWLLGMGDNFAPEFGASIQLQSADCHCVDETASKDEKQYPKYLYKSDDRIPTGAPCDNVTNFLIQAGYRALVPGREDFIYSSYWLRDMALVMRKAAGEPLIANNDHRLDMLAANLRLAPGGTTNKGQCSLLFAEDPFGTGATRCTSKGNVPETFDWVERLDKALRNETRSAIEGAMSAEGLAKELPQDAKRDRGRFRALIDDELRSETQSAEEIRKTVATNQLAILKAAWGKSCALASDFDKNALTDPDGLPQHLLCANQVAPDDLQSFWKDLRAGLRSTFSKQPTEAHDLLISSESMKAAQRQLLYLVADELEDKGYTVVGRDSNQKILVVGVVGKNTMSATSRQNLTICLKGTTPVPCEGGETSDQTANVKVADPISAVVMAIRAARLKQGSSFSHVIVMAQMTAPDAEVLAARVRARFRALPPGDKAAGQFVDAVLSEAQLDYENAKLSLSDVDTKMATPVFAAPAPNFNTQALKGANANAAPEPKMPGTVGRLSFGPQRGSYQSYSLPTVTFPSQSPVITTTSEVRRLMPEKAKQVVPCLLSPSGSSPVPATPGRGNQSDPCFDSPYQDVLAILESLQRGHRDQADVVVLERRDLFLGEIPKGYGGGDSDKNRYCPEERYQKECLLRVALDRLLWKGDYLERVAVKGADLAKILDASAAQMTGESELKATDLSQQWLVTYGITQPALTNLTMLSAGGDPLWLPGDPECKQADQSKSGSVYCVNGRPLTDDQIYWVATSDALAEDQTIYTQFGSAAAENRETTPHFLTEVSAKALLGLAGENSAFRTDEAAIRNANIEVQQQRLYQIDFTKLVLGFNNSHALGPTDQIPTQLQGVADSRAAVPHSQDVDLEATLRLIDDHVFYQSAALGTLTSFVYERSVKGNLSGSPEAVAYQQNNATFGVFGQLTLKHDPDTRSRALPRNLVVVTPHQFQTQINNARLFIAFTAKDNAGQPIPGQMAIALPVVNSFSDKGGFRREWGMHSSTSWNLDSGSYAEGGFEYSTQNNILRSVTLTNGAQQLTCTARANVDIGSCFKSAKATFPIGPTTMVVGKPDAATLHTPGAYWDIHLSRKLNMGPLRNVKSPFTLISDSQGDVYFGRPEGAQLPTQTRYAVTWSSSLNFPVWANLSVAPTYNAFFYRPQLSSLHEQIRNFSISLRWYTARDQRVPVERQLRLTGPASADQTKSSAKSK
jgi:hypothetical protein